MRYLTLLLLLASPVFSQDPQPPTPPAALEISAATEYKIGQFIDIEAKGGPGNAIRWRFKDPVGPPPEIRYPNKDSKRVIELSFRPGVWTLECSVSDGTSLEDASHTFAIEGTGPTPPKPDPPKPISLAQLAGEKRETIGQVYATLLADIGKNITSLDVYKDAEKASLDSLSLATNPAVLEIGKRIHSLAFDKLAAELTKIVSELSVAPVPSGKKLIVLVHESADDDAAMGRLVVNIRDGEIAKYLKDNGHSALILDKDLDAPVLSKLKPFDNLPTVYVLDAATQAVTYKQAAPTVGSEFLAAIKKGGA